MEDQRHHEKAFLAEINWCFVVLIRIKQAKLISEKEDCDSVPSEAGEL